MEMRAQNTEIFLLARSQGVRFINVCLERWRENKALKGVREGRQKALKAVNG